MGLADLRASSRPLRARVRAAWWACCPISEPFQPTGRTHASRRSPRSPRRAIPHAAAPQGTAQTGHTVRNQRLPVTSTSVSRVKRSFPPAHASEPPRGPRRRVGKRGLESRSLQGARAPRLRLPRPAPPGPQCRGLSGSSRRRAVQASRGLEPELPWDVGAESAGNPAAREGRRAGAGTAPPRPGNQPGRPGLRPRTRADPDRADPSRRARNSTLPARPEKTRSCSGRWVAAGYPRPREGWGCRL